MTRMVEITGAKLAYKVEAGENLDSPQIANPLCYVVPESILRKAISRKNNSSQRSEV
ncbi:hypothetical protein WN48_10932 [Eufriesea mexicana]|uniref:Uncharacterized protein n=1 Tax=Eufriesea mexicana TaxID=516756 RepID=A0A310SI87_9HYME|nr:hypothetical protein WN48_10932 [Eufriesea mexicana]